jgi:phosphoglycerol transferase MdoB-like AlkP superfamily enzyme
LAQRIFYYSDWTLGKFIESAEQKPYFKNTIFIITADHAKYHGKFNKDKFHIPLVIYSPLIKKSKKVDRIASQMNLPMTVLKFAGFSGKVTDTAFFAKSVFDGEEIVYAMFDPYFSVTTKDYFYRESLSGQFYFFDDEGNVLEDYKPIKPLQEYARANLQISHYLFLNFKVNTNWHERGKMFKSP